MYLFRTFFAALLICLPATAFAQGLKVGFGDLRQEKDAPVEVTADNLDINQEDGSAVFTGNVLIIQGAMRLTSPKVHVFYEEVSGGISSMKALEGVTVVNGDDAAEAVEANYDISGGSIVMIGNVLLTTGSNIMSSERMTVDLDAGTAQMNGRVKTVLKPASDE